MPKRPFAGNRNPDDPYGLDELDALDAAWWEENQERVLSLCGAIANNASVNTMELDVDELVLLATEIVYKVTKNAEPL